MTGTYTWKNSREFCDTTAHRTDPTCGDCQDPVTCAGCGDVIPAGTAYRYCVDNGEGACNARCAARAMEAWGDDYW